MYFTVNVNGFKELTEAWKEYVRERHCHLYTRTVLIPPVYFNRVSYKTTIINDCEVKVIEAVTQMSDVRGDEAQGRIHDTFKRMFCEDDDAEPMVIIFDLMFDNYLNGSGTGKNRSKGKKRKGDMYINRCEGDGQPSDKVRLAFYPDSTVRHNGQFHPYATKDQKTSDRSAITLTSNTDLSIFRRPRDTAFGLQRGQFDILIIHRQYGIMLFDIKTVGDAFHLFDPAQEEDTIVRKTQKSLQQLQRGEEALKYILGDVGIDGVPITKGLIRPNLKRSTMQAVLNTHPELEKMFCQTLGVTSLKDALQQCIFSEQLPPIGHSADLYKDLTDQLRHDWWGKLEKKLGTVFKGMNNNLFETLLARFCGPATRHLFTTAQTRLAQVDTPAQAVLETHRCYTAPVLTEHQVTVLRENKPRMYLSGLPGTNKTLMLVLKGREWLSQGKTVVVISLWPGSEAVSHFIYQKIGQDLLAERGNLHSLLWKHANLRCIVRILSSLLHNIMNPTTKMNGTENGSDSSGDSWISDDGDFCRCLHNSKLRCMKTLRTSAGTDVRTKNGVFEFSPPSVSTEQKAWLGEQSKLSHLEDKHKLHLVLDETPWFLEHFMKLLEDELGKDAFVMWAGSSLPNPTPKSFTSLDIHQSLRCPPVVVSQMMKSPAYSIFARSRYTSLDSGVFSSMPLPTNGPSVKLIPHYKHMQRPEVGSWDCEKCGREVADFLTRDLKIGNCQPGTSCQQGETLCFSDVLISGYLPTLDHGNDFTRFDTSRPMELFMDATPHGQPVPGFLMGLKRGGVSFDIIAKKETAKIQKLTHHVRTNCVQIAEPEIIMGLERPVVVVIGTTDITKTAPRYVDPQFDVMACCTSQLILVGDVEPSH